MGDTRFLSSGYLLGWFSGNGTVRVPHPVARKSGTHPTGPKSGTHPVANNGRQGWGAQFSLGRPDLQNRDRMLGAARFSDREEHPAGCRSHEPEKGGVLESSAENGGPAHCATCTAHRIRPLRRTANYRARQRTVHEQSKGVARRGLSRKCHFTARLQVADFRLQPSASGVHIQSWMSGAGRWHVGAAGAGDSGPRSALRAQVRRR